MSRSTTLRKAVHYALGFAAYFARIMNYELLGGVVERDARPPIFFYFFILNVYIVVDLYLCECLVEVGDDIIDMLHTDG